MADIKTEYAGFVDNVGLAYYHEKVKGLIDLKISALIDGAPEDLNTLDELAAALKDNKNVLDAYYTKTEVNDALQEKSDSTHNHDTSYFKKTEIDSKLASKSNSDHTHDNYLDVEGTAAAAKKLTTNNGSETQPVYFKDGVPVATKYSLAASVPSGAKFTDTTYGTATTSADGLMSAEDKKKLDGIAANANNYTYTLPTASSSALGGIKTDYTQNGKNYAIKVDDSGNAYVNVPWVEGSGTVVEEYVPLSGGTMTGALRLPRMEVLSTDNYPSIRMYNKDKVQCGWIQYAADTNHRRFSFVTYNADQDEKTSNKFSAAYQLPSAPAGLTESAYYNILTSRNAVTIAQGGTGASTAAQALTNLGAAAAYHIHEGETLLPSCLELTPTDTSAGHGGYLDFHFNKSSSDFTSRIIESNSGTLEINKNANVQLGTLTNNLTISTSYCPAINLNADSQIRVKIFSNDDASYRFTIDSYASDQTTYTERYTLPIATTGLTATKNYHILTTKQAVSIEQGGTGATTAAAALTNLGAAPASHGTHVSDTNLTQWNAAYSHSTSTHAPSNAQKNSDITKAEIEAKLTGTITSHNHNGVYVTNNDLSTAIAQLTLQSLSNVTIAKNTLPTGQSGSICLLYKS